MQEGKGGTYYPPFPVLGLASDGRQIFLTAGGGGATASKEVPNVVQAHRFDEATGKLSTIGSLGTEKQVVIHLSYAASSGLWLASANASCKVLEFKEAASTLEQVCEWQSELEGKDPSQNVARCSLNGELIATGGTDGVLRIWSTGAKLRDGQEPTLKQTCPKQKEILDLDFSPDGKFVAACDRSGACRLLDISTGEEKVAIQYDLPGTPKVTLAARAVRFVPNSDQGGVSLVLAASAPRGPAYLGSFTVAGKKLCEVKVDAKPLTALAVDMAGRWVMVNLVTGGKRVYSLPKLKLVKNMKDVHELPAPCAAFIGEGTAVSGSGDRSIHIMRFGRGSGGSFGSTFMYMIAILIVFAVVLSFVIRIGLKGSVLDQGRGEL